jgi:hypothetical protein
MFQRAATGSNEISEIDAHPSNNVCPISSTKSERPKCREGNEGFPPTSNTRPFGSFAPSANYMRRRGQKAENTLAANKKILSSYSHFPILLHAAEHPILRRKFLNLLKRIIITLLSSFSHLI